MRYLIILLFLSGCATNTITLDNVESTTITQDNLNYDDLEHRLRAKQLGIPYVDYLHLVNNNKKSVNKSYFKLRHNNE